MNFVSSYYWQQREENASALILMQAYYRKKEIPVLLACVCEGEEQLEDFLKNRRESRIHCRKIENLEGNLADWFYQMGLPLCGQGGMGGWKKAVKSLKKLLLRSIDEMAVHGDTTEKNGEGMKLNGIFCVGSRFLRFGRGRGAENFFLLNIWNAKVRCHKLRNRAVDDMTDVKTYGRAAGRESIFLEQGIMQEGIAILLTTEGFAENLDESLIEENLDVREVNMARDLDRQIRKLGKRRETENGRNMGAILICVR